ncbi:MAG: DUF2914 domain-containing protein [Balneolaceae bacterium]|nr:DUF2914 domain-containing protein [Balneolaceae bacterium]
MKKALLSTFAILFMTAFSAQAQIDVSSLQFGTDVENREIVGEDSVFTTDVGTVYCLTRITGVQDTAMVTHVWYHNNEEMGRVELPVRSNNWRTWSSKQIWETWTGEWSVDVLGPTGEVLKSETFTIEEAGGME